MDRKMKRRIIIGAFALVIIVAVLASFGTG